MQMLFQSDMGKQNADQVRLTFWREQGSTSPDVRGFADDLFRVATDRSTEIDGLIEKHAEHWRMERMAAVDRNLLRGDTAHYDVIVNEVTRGIGQSAQETGVPHAFGVLTCENLEQAIDRAGLKMGNKGFEAALAAVEMGSLRAAIKRQVSGIGRERETLVRPGSDRSGKPSRKRGKKRG